MSRERHFPIATSSCSPVLSKIADQSELLVATLNFNFEMNDESYINILILAIKWST